MQGFPRQGLPDLPVVQAGGPRSRCQSDALQNVGGEQQGSVVPVAPDLLVQVFRAGKVQAVDRLVQEKQFGFQGKGGDEKGFLPVAGGQVTSAAHPQRRQSGSPAPAR